ncbi:MAG: hypothetical protein LBQ00_06665 [Syntrophobacterales bacterium]|nr:hypothetical protein [Syntrophobacterales bacterium]
MIGKTIRKLMIDKDVTAAAVAREAKCTRQNVTYVIDGRIKDTPVKGILARHLGKPVDELWPPNEARHRK